MADHTLAIEPVYKALYHETTRNQAINLIKSHQLFDPKSVLKLISEGRVSMAIEILNVEKAYYDKFDLNDTEAIIDALANLPDLGKIEVIKGGMFSKDGEKCICPNGHKNDPDRKHCTTCNLNIKGLTVDDTKEIESFKKRIVVLKDLLLN
ncbi:MAG: hypothetical protein IJL04_03660 [Bacteroidales bacterium]|nr:hypothetical protein [Bacteroidales bacterium]